MSDQRRIATWKWVKFSFLLLITYLLSYGPVVWLSTNGWLPPWCDTIILIIFLPMHIIDRASPQVIRDAFFWYDSLWRN